MSDFLENLKVIRASMERAAQKVGQTPSEVTLIAVSKTKSIEAVDAALVAGQRVFGENRVQEALQKFQPLRADYKDIELHLIGPLQTNKAHEAVQNFDVIQTVDRPKLAAALAKEVVKQGRCPRLYIQVNIGKEQQKHGIMPDELDSFFEMCVQDYGLKIDGLMSIPPYGEDPVPYFARLKEMADRLGLSHISMGMSADFEKAIELGATEVRVGSALFGSR